MLFRLGYAKEFFMSFLRFASSLMLVISLLISAGCSSTNSKNEVVVKKAKFIDETEKKN
jgi:hypothetical protein